MGELMKVVRVFDPAIQFFDLETKSGVKILDWAEERDFDKLVFRPGTRPRVYHCAPLRRSQMRWVEGADNEWTARDRAFAMAVRKIEREDGSTWEPAGVHQQQFLAISEAEMDEMHTTDVQDIGGVVLTRSRIPFGLAVSYPVPPSSRAVLDAALSRFVARSLAAARQTKSGPAEPSGD